MKKRIKLKKIKEILNHSKKLGMKDPIYELSLFILLGLKYLGTNFFINKNHEEKL